MKEFPLDFIRQSFRLNYALLKRVKGYHQNAENIMRMVALESKCQLAWDLYKRVRGIYPINPTRKQQKRNTEHYRDLARQSNNNISIKPED